MKSDHTAGAIVLLGGYGVVGTELAHLLRRHHPDLPVVLAGRRPQAATALAERLGARTLHWDLAGPQPPEVRARAVVALVNDPSDHALTACLTSGVPYVDIARWTTRLHRAIALTAARPPTAPVVFSSGWMGGLVPRLAGHLAAGINEPTEVDVAVRYDLADRAGADSVEFLDRLDRPFEAAVGGTHRLVVPLRDRRRATIGADTLTVGRIDTPEQFTLPTTLGVGTAATRIGFNSAMTNQTLLALHRLGFFRLARHDRLTGLRRALLYRPGPGGEARVAVTVRGPAGGITATLRDAAGQAHLTAVGALLSLRDALGAHQPTVLFPELLADAGLPVDLASFGVAVDIAPQMAPAKAAA